MKKNIRPYSWMSSKIAAKKSGKAGQGMFAREIIRKGELLMVLGGYVFTRAQEDKLPESIRDLAHQISEDFVIGVIDEDRIQEADHVNHSCSPNAGFKGQIFLVAMRNIKVKEEITFDYAMVPHKSPGAKPYILECLCGSKNCRGFINEDGWKDPSLQKKYKGYFQWYLQEKIDNLERRRHGRRSS